MKHGNGLLKPILFPQFKELLLLEAKDLTNLQVNL